MIIFNVMENILQRIKQISDIEDVKITALESKIGASKGVLSRAIKNNTDIQSKWISKIVENYPQYDAEWLLTGHGDMMKNHLNLLGSTKVDTRELEREKLKNRILQKEVDELKIPIAIKTNNNEGIPLLTIKAMAGVFTEEVQVMDYECERYIIPAFKGADFLIPIKGSSMYPKYSSGDIVACKKLESWSFFQFGKVYVIYTSQGPVIKRILESDKPDHIMIYSENETRYPPFDLHKEEILGVAIVIGVIRLE